MPRGRMRATRLHVGEEPLRGSEGIGTIVVEYEIPSGTHYEGTKRRAYLPDDEVRWFEPLPNLNFSLLRYT